MKIQIGFTSGADTGALTVSRAHYAGIWEWFSTGRERAIRFRAETSEGEREYSLVRPAVEYIVAVVGEDQ